MVLKTAVNRFCRFYRGRNGLIDDFDELGLDPDPEMWFSITPKEIAKSHAENIQRDPENILSLDAFCGVGGDILHMPPQCFVVGCDIIQERLNIARSLNDKLGKAGADFVLTDSVHGKPCFRLHAFDAVYLSPPWGHEGVRNRRKAPVFGNRKLSSLALNGTSAFQRALKLAKNHNIAYFLPRGIDENELWILGELTGNGDRVFVDIHESFDPDDETCDDPVEKFKVRAITAYYGRLADLRLGRV
jgi:hypothetical protein